MRTDQADSGDQVVIVAAGTAWPLYTSMTPAYICQNGRSFRDVAYLGFYSARTIHQLVPRILRRHDDVWFTDAEAARLLLSIDPWEQRLGRTIQATRTVYKQEQAYTVLLLSSPEDEATVHIGAIHHGGASAWTMGQRYQSLPALSAASDTRELIK